MATSTSYRTTPVLGLPTSTMGTDNSRNLLPPPSDRRRSVQITHLKLSGRERHLDQVSAYPSAERLKFF
jgi:hypothetical protein